MTALEFTWPCLAPYCPPHRWNRGKTGIADSCELCHGTGVVSADVLATLVTRPYPATFDDGGKQIFPAGVEIVRE